MNDSISRIFVEVRQKISPVGGKTALGNEKLRAPN